MKPSIEHAALALYMAGKWTLPGLPAEQQAKLWEDLRDALGLEPGTSSNIVDAELSEWSIVPLFDGLYAFGKVRNDRKGRFDDGDNIRTSPVLSREGDIIKTLNSTYRLVGQETA